MGLTKVDVESSLSPIFDLRDKDVSARIQDMIRVAKQLEVSNREVLIEVMRDWIEDREGRKSRGAALVVARELKLTELLPAIQTLRTLLLPNVRTQPERMFMARIEETIRSLGWTDSPTL